MKTLGLFTLLSLISLCFNKSPSQEKPEKKTLAIINRYIDFTGKVGAECDSKSSNYIYKLYFYAQITGFTSDEYFILYVKKPEYGYMSCTIKYSTEVSSYVVCGIDVHKYYPKAYTIELKDVFPTIPDCQISNWNAVSKSYYLVWNFNSCAPSYQQEYRVSSITDPLCESRSQNIIQIKGEIRHKIGTDVKVLPEYNFFLPTIVDNSEKSIYCTIKYRYDKKDWIFYCKFSGSKTLTLFPTIIYYPETKSHIMFYISENFQLVNCYSPSNTIKFLEVNSKCNKDLNVLNVPFSSF